ncbi:hypothetical protein GCM10027589_34900 [Actinocorallia lasiicapitis]
MKLQQSDGPATETVTPRRWERAVVIGAGISGLAAAAALSRSFASVVVVERDRLPQGEEPRPGVPQARHPHGLFIRGGMELEKLLPGLREELRRDGAPTFDLGEQMDLRVKGRTPPRLTLGLQLQTFSRNFLEWRVRRRVAELPQVEFRAGVTVTGLRYDAAARRVTGVEGQVKDDRTARVLIDADLVVDASGRTSKLPQWLDRCGYAVPEPVVSDPGMEYVSCVYSSGERLTESCQFTYEVGGTRGAAALAVERGRMMMILIGTVNDPPPTDYPGFVAWTRGLTNPIFTELAASAEPVSGLRRYGMTTNRRFNYHRMRRWPERIVAVGDAVCAFNPVYGQGMTMGALDAVALADALERRTGDLDGFARPFQRRLARLALPPWLMAVSQDSLYRDPSVPSPLFGRVAGRYMTRIFVRLPDDPALYRTFLRVFQMTASPTILATPRNLYRCLRRHRPAQPGIG